MTIRDKERFEQMLGYRACFVSWGNQTGTHICVRPMGHADPHWSGCCDAKITYAELTKPEDPEVFPHA